MKTPFYSYAQNFEDLMLHRALGSVEHGFYIDIGAQHPEVDSVSKAFFDRGWRGIHVEPVPHYAELLRKERPDDRVIEAAVSRCIGHITLTVFPDTGLSTAVPDIAAGHVDAGVPVLEAELEVPTVTLAGIAAELGDCEVHWLKIDVEGLEKEVLEGWDPSTLRPWIIVVESTLPNSEQSSHSEWEDLLTHAGYEYIYYDGLNRFYAMAEKVEQLKPAFKVPPNVFDDVQLGKHAFMCRSLCHGHVEQMTEIMAHHDAELIKMAAHHDAEVRHRMGELSARYESALRQHEAEIQRSQQEVARVLQSQAKVVAQLSDTAVAYEFLQHQWQQSQQRIEQADLLHQAMLKSLSWRLTSPLRWGLDFLSIAGRKKDAAKPSVGRPPTGAVDHQPSLSPGTRAWLAIIDPSAEEDDA